MVIKCENKEKMLAVLSKLELETNCMWFSGGKPTGYVPDPYTFPIYLLIDEASRITWKGNDINYYAHFKELLTDDEYLTCKTADDPVDHPSHYTQGKVECIDAMEEALGTEVVKGFCLGNTYKYLWRHADKNGDEDIKKAVWYFSRYKQILNR